MFLKVNQHISQIKAYQSGQPIEKVARELGLDEDFFLKLASNESALGVSYKAKEALLNGIETASLYPDSDAYELKNCLANHYDYSSENFIIGSGSNEVLVFLSQCFMSAGKSIVVSSQAFAIYKILAQISDCEFREISMTGLTHNLDAMAEAIDETTSIVFICNPNNPTGTMVGDDEIRRFIKKVPKEVLIVFDEAYAEICLEKMPNTLQYINKNNHSVIVLRSFSKAYGLAGLRIGYGIARKDIITTLEKVRQPFNTTILSQKAAIAALGDVEFLIESRKIYADSKKYIEGEFAKLGISYEPTVANFILFEIEDAANIYKELMKCGIIVRQMSIYGLSNHLRVTFGIHSENQRFIEALSKLIK